jgi:ribosome maturation factor RimP
VEEGTTVPSFVEIPLNMISKDSVYQIVEDYIDDKNYYLVDVKVTSDNRISVEIDALDGVTIEFCMEVNRHIESQLDREIEDYELEVSSAGLTEPFKVPKQYEKNIGNEVEVLTKVGKKVSGILIEVSETEIVLEIEKTEKPEGAKRKIIVTENLTFPFEEIKTTKYIIRFK